MTSQKKPPKSQNQQKLANQSQTKNQTKMQTNKNIKQKPITKQTKPNKWQKKTHNHPKNLYN